MWGRSQAAAAAAALPARAATGSRDGAHLGGDRKDCPDLRPQGYEKLDPQNSRAKVAEKEPCT